MVKPGLTINAINKAIENRGGKERLVWYAPFSNVAKSLYFKIGERYRGPIKVKSVNIYSLAQWLEFLDNVKKDMK
jgi:hypothetical protein